MATREGNRFELPLHAGGETVRRLGSMAAPVAASPHPPAVQRRKSDVVWEAHKATIKALYIDEDRSLKEVMEIMRSNYGFEASPKLFKARIKRWGFSKYITSRLEREALQHMVSNGLQRERVAEHETVRLSSGATISLSSLVTHLDRKRSAASLYPMLVPRSLRLPDDLWISEEMLVNAREYIRKEYLSKHCADHDIREILPLHYGDLCKGLVAVRRLLKEAKVDEALLVLRQAPNQIRASLLGPAASNAFGCICMTVLCIKWDDSRAEHMIATLRALLKYAASIVLENSGPEPLRRILLRLAVLDDAVFREAIIRTWKCELQTWTAMVEPGWNIPLLSEWLALAETAGVDQLPPNLGQGLEDAIRSHEAQYGRSSLPVLTLLWFQAEYERLLAEKRGTSMDKARGVFLDLLGRGPELDMLSQYAAQYFLAKEYRRCGDRVNAEKFLREAIESLCALEDRPCYGISAPLELMFDLERWFTEWGEHEKARDTRQRRLNLRLAHERRSQVNRAWPTNQQNQST